MKKTFSALLVFLIIGISAVMANERPDIDPKILSAFQKGFSFAKNAKWEVKGNLTQVNFLLNDHGVTAWYNSDAELVSTARNILYNQLPISIIRTLEKQYAGADYFGITEVSRNNETYYQIRADEKNRKFLLKASLSGNISVLKKFR
jgi:hypothetical protein